MQTICWQRALNIIIKADLREAFQALGKYKMKLNPTKCAIGVISRKFPSFIVIKEEQKSILTKFKQSSVYMSTPTNFKQLQSLNGKIAALSRFFNRATNKCLPFFNILKGFKFEWRKECDNAFSKLKAYLGAIPLLAKPILGENLLLYPEINETIVSSTLVKEENDHQQPVYNTSKTMARVETRYPQVEQHVLVVIILVRRVHPYFQAYRTTILPNFPLRQVL